MSDSNTVATANRSELWRLKQLALVSQVATQVTSIHNLDKLLVRVVGLIYQTFEFYTVCLYTLEGDRLTLRAQAGPARTFSAEEAFIPVDTEKIPLGQGIIGWVAAHKQELVVTDVWREQRFRYSPEFPNTEAEIALPLTVEDRLLGVLDVQLDYPEDFDESDLLVLRALAGQVSMAIEDTRLYQVQASLRRISSVLISDVDLQSILKTILLELKHNLPADVLAVWLFVDAHIGTPAAKAEPGQRRRKRLLLSTVEPAGAVELPPNFDPHSDPWLKIGLNSKAPTVRQPHHPADPIAARLGYPASHSAITAPLQVQKRRLGLLTLTHHEAGRYGQEARAVVTAFANQAAIAIENARLFRMAQTEAKISNALLQVAAATQDMDNLEPALTAITQVASLIAEVDRCAIWLRAQDENVFKPTAASGFTAEAARFFQQCVLQPDRVPAIARLDHTRAPLVILNAARDPRLPADIASKLALNALVLLPVVAHGDMLGLMLVSFISPALIRENDIRLLSGVARQAAAAIESKFLYEQKLQQERLAHELELAKEIQSMLIPSHLSAPPGWEVAACWRAAQEVAGDFYDFIEVSPDRLGLVIADVSGKGMPAALFMALTRSLIRAVAPGQSDPRVVLARVNQLLLPDTQRGKFVSLFYAVLDTGAGRLTFSNAGHNPPFLIRADGSLETLHIPGIVLGVRPDIQPQLGQTRLNPGDGIVLYTDGVTEVFDTSADIFGEERLKEILRTGWADGPQALVDRIRQAVNRFSATDLPHDDFTLLILRRQHVNNT